MARSLHVCIPQVGDYDGDGQTDTAAFRPSNGSWWVFQRSRSYPDSPLAVTLFGVGTDKPVAADYTGDGKTDIAVWRPSDGTWFIQRSTQGTYIQQFGMNGDIPVESAFVP